MVYLGPTPGHARDVCTMYNLTTRKTVVTRDVQWMNMMYGDWKKLPLPEQISFLELNEDLVEDKEDPTIKDEGKEEVKGTTKDKVQCKVDQTAKVERPIKQLFQSSLKPKPPTQPKLERAMK